MSPRTARRCVPTRTNVLLGCPITPHGHSQQPPATEHPKHEPNPLPRVACRAGALHTDTAASTHRSGIASAIRGDTAAAVTSAKTPVMMAVAVMSMDGASPAHREQKHVSAHMRARTMASRAQMRTCERAVAGVPSCRSSRSPLRKALQDRFGSRDPSKRRAGPHARVRTPSCDSRRRSVMVPW